MSRVPEAEVRALADLCRLSLNSEEVERFALDLSRVITHLEQLAEVDVDGVEPFIGPELPEVALRVDESDLPLPRERALACAPKHDDAYVLVPRFKEEM